MTSVNAFNATRVAVDDVAIPDHLRPVILHAADWRLIHICECVQTAPSTPPDRPEDRSSWQERRDELRDAVTLIDQIERDVPTLPRQVLLDLTRAAAKDLDGDIRYEVDQGLDHDKVASMSFVARDLWAMESALSESPAAPIDEAAASSRRRVADILRREEFDLADHPLARAWAVLAARVERDAVA